MKNERSGTHERILTVFILENSWKSLSICFAVIFRLGSGPFLNYWMWCHLQVLTRVAFSFHVSWRDLWKEGNSGVNCIYLCIIYLLLLVMTTTAVVILEKFHMQKNFIWSTVNSVVIWSTIHTVVIVKQAAFCRSCSKFTLKTWTWAKSA